MQTISATEKVARLQHIIAIEHLNVTDPKCREMPPFSNRGPFVEECQRRTGNHAGDSWCMSYQYRVFEDAGYIDFNGMTLLKKTGLVQAQVNYMRSQGLLISAATAQTQGIFAGDLVFLWFPELGRFAHVELVTDVATKGDFRSIGGNTTNAPGERNGDRVASHQRNVFDQQGGRYRYCFGRTR